MVSRNWYSRCRQTHDVFYFGEEVDIYEDGQIVRHEGAWEAGKNGSQPGIIPARFLLGARDYQELRRLTGPWPGEDSSRLIATPGQDSSHASELRGRRGRAQEPF
ncbi:MAG TPA: hypothetical protein VN493_25565 [Thermoanaerobaculia bacterium]|nr:hypothetical protein [Thermoanaerobaculia bacterium]